MTTRFDSHLPPLNERHGYMEVELNGQYYITTGGFENLSGRRTRAELSEVGCLVLDFDFVDWVARQQSWPTAGEAAKNNKSMMYAMYLMTGSDGKVVSTDARLSDLKRFRDDVVSAIEEAIADVDGACMPTYVVNTGWGCHAYFWLSKNQTNRAGIDRARALNHWLVKRVNSSAGYDICDPSVHDAGTRLLRPLWTEQYPSVNSKAPGYPVKIKINEELSSPGNRWDLDACASIDLSAYKEEPTAKVAVSTGQASNADDGSASTSRRLRNLISWLCSDKATNDLFDKASEGQDSETTMALATHLAGRRLPVPVIAMITSSVRTDGKHDIDWHVKGAIKASSFVRDPVAPGAVDYRVMHEDVALSLEPRMSTSGIVNLVVRRDSRLKDAMWCHSGSGMAQWSSDEKGQAAHRGLLTEALDENPVIPDRDTALSDNDMQIVLQWIERVYGRQLADKASVYTPVVMAGLRRRNPVVEYLDDCRKKLTEASDKSLLDYWLIRAFGLPDTQLVRTISRKWIIGGAARAHSPGVFIKGMLTLISGQSAAKSTMFRILGGDFYLSPDTKDLSSKDTKLQCHEAWLLELEEMDFIGRNTSEAIKTFLTTTKDKLRRPYGRVVEEFHRSCFYAATSNRKQILRDSTGNDRYWPVDIGDRRCNVEYVKTIRDELWGLASAAWLELRGASDTEKNNAINMTLEELTVLRVNNDAFMDKDESYDEVLSVAWLAASLRTGAMEDGFLYVTSDELAKVAGKTEDTAFVKLKHATQLRLRSILETAGFKNDQRRCRDGSNRRKWVAPDSWFTRFRELTEERSILEAANPTCTAIWPDDHVTPISLVSRSKPILPDLGTSPSANN